MQNLNQTRRPMQPISGQSRTKRARLDSPEEAATAAPSSTDVIWDAIDSADPGAALCVFRVLLESLDGVTKYFKDSKILLDMQEMVMLLHDCSRQGAKDRICRLNKASKSNTLLKKDSKRETLSRYRIPGSRGHGKVVIELRHALEYILGQRGEIPSRLRGSLIEIAMRAKSSIDDDTNFSDELAEWKQTQDPVLYSTLMTGYVQLAEEELRILPPVEDSHAEVLPCDVVEDQRKHKSKDVEYQAAQCEETQKQHVGSGSTEEAAIAPSSTDLIWGAIDSADPGAALCVFRVLLESLDGVTKYFKDSKILLDMQEMVMLLHDCSRKGAKDRICRLNKGRKSAALLKKDSKRETLSRYRIPGSSGHGKVVIELRHALEYVLGQRGEIPSRLRGSLIQIAMRASAGDLDLFNQVSDWKSTMDPTMRAMLMSGYTCSEEAKTSDPLAPVEELTAAALPCDAVDAGPVLISYQSSGQSLEGWLACEQGMTTDQMEHEAFIELRRAAAVGVTNEQMNTLWTAATVEWKKFCATRRSFEKKEFLHNLTKEEREKNRLHDEKITDKREDRRTRMMDSQAKVREQETKLKELRLTFRENEKQWVRKVNEAETKRAGESQEAQKIREEAQKIREEEHKIRDQEEERSSGEAQKTRE